MREENVLTAMSVNDKFKVIRKPSNMCKMLDCQQKKITKMITLKRWGLNHYSEFVKEIYNHYIVNKQTKEEFI